MKSTMILFLIMISTQTMARESGVENVLMSCSESYNRREIRAWANASNTRNIGIVSGGAALGCGLASGVPIVPAGLMTLGAVVGASAHAQGRISSFEAVSALTAWAARCDPDLHTEEECREIFLTMISLTNSNRLRRPTGVIKEIKKIGAREYVRLIRKRVVEKKICSDEFMNLRKFRKIILEEN